MNIRSIWLAGLVAVISYATYADQTRIKDYEQARQLFWSILYAEGGDTLYCRVRFTPRDRRGLNIEHVFPMGWVTNALKCGRRKECRERNARFNRIEADLHNLFPARRDINDARGSFRFGEVPGERRDYGRCDFEVDEVSRVAEPGPASRGEIARALFYMRDEYGLTIFRRLGERLKRWHRADPPSNDERRRNDRIEKLQGTRNKYIDQPLLVDEIQF